MRIRQLIAAIMILLSLSAQARTFFVCDVMPGATLASPCCPPDSGHPCCHEVGSTDALFAQSIAVANVDHERSIGVPDLQLAVVVSFVPPAAFDSDGGGAYEASPELSTGRYRVRPLYLQTARLRL